MKERQIKAAQLVLQTMRLSRLGIGRLAKVMVRSLVVMILTLLLAIALLKIAQGLFEVWAYYYFNKGPHTYPMSMESIFLGLKLATLYLVVVWVFTLYRSPAINQAIVKRSAKWGVIIGALLISLVAIDRLVIHYYTKQIDCKYPVPPQKPYCKPNVMH